MSTSKHERRPVISGLILLGTGLLWLAVGNDYLTVSEMLPLVLIMTGIAIVVGAITRRSQKNLDSVPPTQPPYTPTT